MLPACQHLIDKPVFDLCSENSFLPIGALKGTMLTMKKAHKAAHSFYFHLNQYLN